MKIISRLVGVALGCCVALPLLAHEPYPSRPVKIIIGFGPGSGSDLLARLFPSILAVNEKVPARSPQEFISWAQANQGKLFYAYSSLTFRIAAESLSRLKQLDAKGVPYKSSPEAMTDVVGDRAQFLVVDLASSQPLVKAGRLRALAVTSSKRTVLAPDLPTVEETLGLRDFDMASWAGLFGPANLPKDVVDKLSGALLKILGRPEIIEKMLAMNIEPLAASPADFRVFLRRQLDVWKQKVRDAGIEPE